MIGKWFSKYQVKVVRTLNSCFRDSLNAQRSRTRTLQSNELAVLASYSTTSTTCSTWCAPHEPRPAPQSPAAATVTNLRWIQLAPRWVGRALLTRFYRFIILFLNMQPNFPALLQSLQSSNNPPTGQHSQSSTAQSNDGLRQQSGPVYGHNMYLQLMQR